MTLILFGKLEAADTERQVDFYLKNINIYKLIPIRSISNSLIQGVLPCAGLADVCLCKSMEHHVLSSLNMRT